MNHPIRAAFVLGALLAVQASVPPHDPTLAWDQSYGHMLDAYKRDGKPLDESDPYVVEARQAQRVCQAHARLGPPARDWPSLEERGRLEGCNSYALYYGIDRPADHVAARHCAMMEMQAGWQPFADYVSGPGILMMIYANGKGVPRNFDAAVNLACAMGDAPAATEGRIESLLAAKAAGGTDENLEVCDHATSGVASAYCSDHKATLAKRERDGRIARLSATWSQTQRNLFARLHDSLIAYADIGHAMDGYHGTAHAAIAIEGQERDLEEFLRRVELLALGETVYGDRPDQWRTRNAATRGLEDWYDKHDREWYEANRVEAVAARIKFERDLLAYMAATHPRFTRHQVRVMFRDI